MQQLEESGMQCRFETESSEAPAVIVIHGDAEMVISISTCDPTNIMAWLREPGKGFAPDINKRMRIINLRAPGSMEQLTSVCSREE
jgi:hypothetical protein